MTFGGRFVEQVHPVDVQGVEQKQRQRRPRLPGGRVARSDPRRSDLKRKRSPAFRERDRLPVGDEVPSRQATYVVHDLGQSCGHVVKRASKQADVRSTAMDLHAGAVELPFHPGLATEPGQRFLRTFRGLGEHRPDRAADLQPEVGEGRTASGQRRGGDGRKIAPKHRRPAHVGERHLRGVGNRVGHDPEQRALPELAAQQPSQEGLLTLGSGGEQACPAAGAVRAASLRR